MNLRYLYFVIACMLFKTSVSQELVPVTDTVNHYQISIPVGWQYGIPTNKSALFMAYRLPSDSTDISSEVMTVNIFHHEETDLKKEYKNFIKSISKRKGFKLLEEHDKTLAGRPYKYIVENHANESMNDEPTTACVLLANDNGRILMVTFATKSSHADKYMDLFDRMSNTVVF